MTELARESERAGLNVHRSLSLLLIALDDYAAWVRTSAGRYSCETLRVEIGYGCRMGSFKLFTAKSGGVPAYGYEGVAPLHYVATELGNEHYRSLTKRERTLILKLRQAAREVLTNRLTDLESTT